MGTAVAVVEETVAEEHLVPAQSEEQGHNFQEASTNREKLLWVSGPPSGILLPVQ